MIIKSFAKINLGLQIENIRNDGFHNLKMIVLFLSLHDIIEISTIKEKKIIVSCSKNVCKNEENFVYKIAEKFFEHFKTDFGVKINIRKNIPDGAGLGGGSSNASSVLYAMNNIFNSNFSTEFMKSISSEVSSDSPLFFSSGITECSGKGEMTRTITNDHIKNCKFLIKKGNEKINTKMAYKIFDTLNSSTVNDNRIDHLKESIKTLDFKKISSNCFNDFEKITNVENGWHLTGSVSASFKIVDKSFKNENNNIIECHQVNSGFEILL